ncbi:MAG: DUF4145 domain-containing protein [Deltaproteobacteria bacterium]|jgi:hypothetical protein|nr:DUF4145 domain-containing protein [Deltaproteobacteria bacterium]
MSIFSSVFKAVAGLEAARAGDDGSMDGPSINWPCPHCMSKNVGFRYMGFNYIEEYQFFKAPSEYDPFLGDVYNTFWTCASCQHGITLVFQRKAVVRECPFVTRRFKFGDFNLLESHPDFMLRVPEHLPGDIAWVFRQGKSNVLQGNYDAGGGALRRALELSTQRMGQDPADGLLDRVKKLRARGRITEETASWAGEIRLIGNDSQHGTGLLSAEEAGDMLLLTEYFLTYVFTLPALMAQRRGGPAPGADGSGAP